MLSLLLLLLQTPAAWPLQSRVHSKDLTSVRTAPLVNATFLANHQCCDPGTLTAGPATDATTVFWQVQFDAGSSGWVRQTALVLDSLAKPVPPPPPPPPPPPAPVATRIVVVPLAAATPVGGLAMFSDTVYDQNRLPMRVGVTWSIGTPALATVDSFGTIRGTAAGVTTVNATAAGVTGTSALTILPAPPPPPLPAPPVFGTRESWVSMLLFGCLPAPGVPCTRVVPVLADSDGHITARDTVIVKYGPP